MHKRKLAKLILKYKLKWNADELKKYYKDEKDFIDYISNCLSHRYSGIYESLYGEIKEIINNDININTKREHLYDLIELLLISSETVKKKNGNLLLK